MPNDFDIRNSGSSPITPEPAKRKCTECDFTAPTKGKLNEHYAEGHEPNCEGDESEEDFYDIPDLALFEPSFNNKGEESEADEDDDEESSEREEEEEGSDPTEEDGDKVNSEGDENDDEDHPKHGHKEDIGHSQRKCTECDFTAPTKGELNEH